jgi:hypothetical protein
MIDKMIKGNEDKSRKNIYLNPQINTIFRNLLTIFASNTNGLTNLAKNVGKYIVEND